MLVLERAPEAGKGRQFLFYGRWIPFVHEGAEDIASDVIPDLTAEERAKIVLPPHTANFSTTS